VLAYFQIERFGEYLRSIINIYCLDLYGGFADVANVNVYCAGLVVEPDVFDDDAFAHGVTKVVCYDVCGCGGNGHCCNGHDCE